ncbi:MAG: PKD domain-containing protein [Actinomycetes bacterium]
MKQLVRSGSVRWGLAGLMAVVLAACTMPPVDPTSTTTTTVDGSTTTTEPTTTTTTTTVPPNQAPVASFTATPSSGQVPVDASFDASASSDADGTVASYDWTFGDGSAGTGVTTSHTYDAIGTYTVTLFVTDDQGAVGSTTRSVVVTKVTTTASPATGPVGTVVTASVPCSPEDGWVDGAAAIVSLVDFGGNVVVTTAVENTDPGTARVDVAFTVPDDLGSGSYSVTSSCDTYLGSTVFDPVGFTVL